MPLLATLATGVSSSSPLFRLGAGVFSAGDNMSETCLHSELHGIQASQGPGVVLPKCLLFI